MQARALIDFGEPSLNRAMRVYGPIGDLSVRAGRYYPSKAPLLSYAAAPVYWVLAHPRRRTHRERSGDPAGLLLPVFPHGSSDTRLAAPAVSGYSSRTRVVMSPTSSWCSTRWARWRSATRSSSSAIRRLRLCSSSPSSSSGVGLARGPSDGWLVLSGFVAALAVVAEYTTAMGAGLLGVYVLLARKYTHEAPCPGAGALRGRFGGATGASRCVPHGVLRRTARNGLPAPCGRCVPAVASRRIPRNPHARPTRLLPVALLAATWALRAVARLAARRPGPSPDVACTRRSTRAGRDHGLHRLADSGVPLLHCELQLRILGLDDGTAAHDRARPVHAPSRARSSCSAASSPVVLGLSRGLLASSILTTGLITLVNYVPDNVSEALFGLVLPLARAGDLVPSVAGLPGSRQPLLRSALRARGVEPFSVRRLLAPP